MKLSTSVYNPWHSFANEISIHPTYINVWKINGQLKQRQQFFFIRRERIGRVCWATNQTNEANEQKKVVVDERNRCLVIIFFLICVSNDNVTCKISIYMIPIPIIWFSSFNFNVFSCFGVLLLLNFRNIVHLRNQKLFKSVWIRKTAKTESTLCAHPTHIQKSADVSRFCCCCVVFRTRSQRWRWIKEVR